MTTLRGYCYRIAKNNMVKDFCRDFGFALAASDGDDAVWELPITEYENKNTVIKANEVQENEKN